VPGQCDRARGRRAGRPAAHDQAERRPREELAEDDVPPAQEEFKALNTELSKLWKPIIERKPAPADADEWKDKTGKLGELIK